MPRALSLLAIALLLLMPATMQSAVGQSYPSRPVTLIVPFAAGGTTDVIARIVGEHMSRTLGQQLVVENVGGAGGTTGSLRAMRASPDGYTLVLGNMGTHAAAVALYPNLAYRPDADFAPIGMVAGLPVVLVARKDFPPDDLRQFARYAKTNSDKLNLGHAGVGSITHVTCLLLDALLELKPTMVPFSGAAPAVNALVAGQVDYMCNVIADVFQQVQSGNLKAYAIAATARNQALPHVPTAAEAGLPEFEALAWNGLFAPEGTPKPILDQLTAALDKALDDETTRRRVLDLGTEIPEKARRGQQALSALVKGEIVRWTPLIKAALGKE
jgi:tripartite-type tricarboxylate transporter receptor subunit TctC